MEEVTGVEKCMNGIPKLFPYVKEVKEILNDFGEVNRLINENWILIGVVSTSDKTVFSMGRLELD